MLSNNEMESMFWEQTRNAFHRFLVYRVLKASL